MRILYGLQGTGHGHISRARELLPELSKQASVDVLISGSAVSHDLNGGTALQKHGISLTYDSNGGVSVLDTLRDFRPIRFILIFSRPLLKITTWLSVIMSRSLRGRPNWRMCLQ
jgi:UDP:flavonoid glycosyltransferase YjiC (YdhE family)